MATLLLQEKPMLVRLCCCQRALGLNNSAPHALQVKGLQAEYNRLLDSSGGAEGQNAAAQVHRVAVVVRSCAAMLQRRMRRTDAVCQLSAICNAWWLLRLAPSRLHTGGCPSLLRWCRHRSSSCKGSWKQRRARQFRWRRPAPRRRLRSATCRCLKDPCLVNMHVSGSKLASHIEAWQGSQHEHCIWPQTGAGGLMLQ